METVTALSRAMALAKSKEAKTTEKKQNPKFTFKSPEFRALIDKDISKDGPMDPVNEIKNFNKVAMERGYNYFDAASMEDWRNKYINVNYNDIEKLANQDTKEFMNAVTNISDPQHNENRRTFVSHFNSDEKKVTAFYAKRRNEIAGRHVLPVRNTGYENRFLNFGVLDTLQKGCEHKVLADLMSARWSAIGYDSENDEKYLEKFLIDYCVALGNRPKFHYQ